MRPKEQPATKRGYGKREPVLRENGGDDASKWETPPVVSLYFRNIPKTDREHTEEAIRELLSHRKLLHVSFIGHSVMELLVEKKDSVTIATFVRSAGMTQMPNFTSSTMQ